MPEISRVVAVTLGGTALVLFLLALPAFLGLAGILSPPSTGDIAQSLMLGIGGFTLLAILGVLAGAGITRTPN